MSKWRGVSQKSERNEPLSPRVMSMPENRTLFGKAHHACLAWNL
jgi:hypothetical protein